jgi:hypothetical protein
MKQLARNIWVGDDSECDHKTGWYIVHACKEPCHRRRLGYKGKGAPKEDARYLFDEDENNLWLNLIDADNMSYISKEIIDKAIFCIRNAISEGKQVLVHCNMGLSRSPTLILLSLANTKEYDELEFPWAILKFKEKYPDYSPANGMREFAKKYWKEYSTEG